MRHLLVIGLGSIGSRHVSTFRKLGVGRIDALRSGTSSLPKLPDVDHQYDTLDDAFKDAPDAAVICNPTSLHASYAKDLLLRGVNILVEKPLATNCSDIEEIQSLLSASSGTVSVAYNMRHHPFIQKLRSWGHRDTPLGDLISARVHFGSYLPAWHPWEDYRQSYAARSDLGGGAALTSIHELDYCLWLWGDAVTSHRMSSHNHPLGTNVDETTFFHIEHHTNVISSVSLSLMQRYPSREMRLSFTSGEIYIDFLKNTWTEIADNRTTTHECATTAITDSYILQAKDFLSIRNGNGSLGTVAEALAASRIINPSI
jgi:predicted dehydrogenase